MIQTFSMTKHGNKILIAHYKCGSSSFQGPSEEFAYKFSTTKQRIYYMQHIQEVDLRVILTVNLTKHQIP